MPIIEDIAADKSTYRPGESARVAVTITNDSAQPFPGRLTLALTNISGAIASVEQAVELTPAASTTVQLSVTPPATPWRGYGLDAALYDGAGQVVATGSGALDVLDHWVQAPRYGFLSEFAPGDGARTARFDSLRRYHCNVVQFYDWMWRHYKLLPAAGVAQGAEQRYTDALGRTLSLASVRQAIQAVQARGAAAFAYGAVYGAEPEFALAHPDLILYDEARQPISLAELFYIMNIAPGSAWLPRIVAEFADAVRTLDFDGIHLDQYGFPKTAQLLDGTPVDLATAFPPLIDAARAAVVAEKPGAGVIFNAVTNWPIETVAPTSADAVYIEVWPPYDSYADLRRLIAEAKDLGGGKPVILAAYLAPFLDATADALPQAEAAAYLATAVIAASGGSHLLLGEQEGLLCDPYYPKFATMRPSFARRMRAYYDFLVRYEEFLIWPDVMDWAANVRLAGSARPLLSPQPGPGAVWTIGRQKPGYRLVHLINLTDQSGTAWNALRTPPAPLADLALKVSDLPPVQQVWLLTPDANQGRPAAAEWQQRGGTVLLRVPQLTVWTSLLFVTGD